MQRNAGSALSFLSLSVSETFAPGTESGGSDAEGRALRYLEWRWDPDPADSTYVTEMVYLLRPAERTMQAVHEQHVMGLFPRAVWLELIAAAGFQPRTVPFNHSSNWILTTVKSVFKSPRFWMATRWARR